MRCAVLHGVNKALPLAPITPPLQRPPWSGDERQTMADNGLQRQGDARHVVTPRVALFLQRDERWLFIEGAAHKWWAGRYNGIGGSVEAGESILDAAQRECEEETGLPAETLTLAAIVHVMAEPSVLLFCFRGTLAAGVLQPCDEGAFHWLSEEELRDPSLPLMADLPFLLPSILSHQAGEAPHHFAFDMTLPFEAAP